MPIRVSDGSKGSRCLRTAGMKGCMMCVGAGEADGVRFCKDSQAHKDSDYLYKVEHC
jgi:hypothetical protein